MNNKMVTFRESDHSYFCDGVRYESVSSVFSTAKPFIDWDYNAGRSFFKTNYPELYDKVKKSLSFDHPELVNKLKKLSKISEEEFKEGVKQLRDSWKENSTEATERGTMFHLKKETEDYKRGWAINPMTGEKVKTMNFEKQYDNQSLADNLYDLPDGYYPELLLFNHDLKIAGQADKVFIQTKGGRRRIDIDDWKTDTNIFIRPDFRHPLKGYERLNHPLSHLYNTNHNIYMMKIGIYAWMLEQFGFEVGSLNFTSVEIDDDLNILKESRYLLPYKKWEVEALLDSYKEKNTMELATS